MNNVVPRAIIGLLSAALSVEADLNSGLLAYYPFNEDQGAIAADASGNGRNAEVRGAKWVAEGINGGAYRFTDPLDLIRADDRGLPEGDAPRTIAFWFSLDALRPPHHATHLVHYGTIDFSRFFSLAIDWRVGRDCPTLSPWGYVSISRQTVDRAREWYHLACVYRGAGQVDFYLDGRHTRGANENNAALRTITGGGLIVGTFTDDNNNLRGAIDEIRVYDRALSTEEIETLVEADARALVRSGESRADLSRNQHARGQELTTQGTGRADESGAHATSAEEAPAEAVQPQNRATVSEQSSGHFVTRIGFSTKPDGDQDVTIFYLDETLHVLLADVDLDSSDTNTLARVSIYQRSDRHGQADLETIMSPDTNRFFRAALPLQSLRPGRAWVDVAGYDLGGQALRIFRTSRIEIRDTPP